MENIKSQIRNILANNEIGNNMVSEIEKLVYAVCQEDRNNVKSTFETYLGHANSNIEPMEAFDIHLPTSVERHWNKKEVLDMCKWAFESGFSYADCITNISPSKHRDVCQYWNNL
jgi:hypothetical protein